MGLRVRGCISGCMCMCVNVNVNVQCGYNMLLTNDIVLSPGAESVKTEELTDDSSSQEVVFIT